jgi:hypothetical protein
LQGLVDVWQDLRECLMAEPRKAPGINRRLAFLVDEVSELLGAMQRKVGVPGRAQAIETATH